MKRALMIQGTSSDAGKSMLVTAMCRYFIRRHLSVAPFKPQNMALNSAVSAEGGEIGRAQAVQAMACAVAPSNLMNPILLKPNSDTGSQVIVNGRSIGNMNAMQYHEFKPRLLDHAINAFQQLSVKYQLVLIEGAGSPAEINLRKHDIANMGFAEAVDCPVLLIADIDRGGVFAHIVGTLELLSESERRRVVGVVINRFRGDIQLLQPGIDWLEKKINKPVLGVLPYVSNLYLEAEDSLANRQLQRARRQVNSQRDNHQIMRDSDSATGDSLLNIAVIALPKISNHTDFDALQLHERVNLRFIQHPDDIGEHGIDVLILPGTKNTRQDLAWLKRLGWENYIHRHLRYAGKLIGICGGYQMLGRCIDDPHGVEGERGTSEGLGLLDFRTELHEDKQLRNVSGSLSFADSAVCGYEIHVGTSHGPALQRPALFLEHGPDGVLSEDGRILGCYLHGLFDQASASHAILQWCGLTTSAHTGLDMNAMREQSIEALADLVEQHLDMERLTSFLELDTPSVSVSL